jgi:hypothetical protein
MVLEQAGRKVWRFAQRFVGPVLRARWLPLVVVAVFALVWQMLNFALIANRKIDSLRMSQSAFHHRHSFHLDFFQFLHPCSA